MCQSGGRHPEELGFGFNMGLNLITYVLKQATNRWRQSQGSGEMGDYPPKQLGVSFYLHLDLKTWPGVALWDSLPLLRNPVAEING